MIGGKDPPPFLDPSYVNLEDDPNYNFVIKQFIEPSDFYPDPPENAKETRIRFKSDTKYCENNSPTQWYRYSTLGRYAVLGEIFESIWEERHDNPTQIHGVIWYQYKYHLDRQRQPSTRLQSWATTLSQPFLSLHEPTILSVDTRTVTWSSFSKQFGFKSNGSDEMNQKTGKMITSTETSSNIVDPSNLPGDEDPIFGFLTNTWIEMEYINQTENDIEKEQRIALKTKFRYNTNPTIWSRYLTLGRYAIDPYTFELIWNEFENDPVRAHSVIWYQYLYYIERNVDVPSKLEAWATKITQIYLSANSAEALQIDTINQKWRYFATVYGYSLVFWQKVGLAKSKLQKKVSIKITPNKISLPTKVKRPTKIKRPSTLVSPPTTILEDPEQESRTSKTTTTPDKSSERTYASIMKKSSSDDLSRASSDGKISAIVRNTNVSTNDGTFRINIKWKRNIESREETEDLIEEIYYLLNELFTDQDGLLYKWDSEGMNLFGAISRMSPKEVRSFLCRSLAIIPSQSLIVIPLRYGFTEKSPTTWRQSSRTKAVLDEENVTVSISNSKSTSGKLTIAGYILLKSPEMTHRLRYLQSLRNELPSETPGFDILIHRKTPTDQEIPHLVVQCGENHVHPLSQALLNILTGECTAVYIPRYAFLDMSKHQVSTLFETHKKYLQSLVKVPLYPVLVNLDTIRTETLSNGTTIERSTREWSRNIILNDGVTKLQCDVVNGGNDKKAYMLVKPEFEHAAKIAFDEYKKSIFEFGQREARFRDGVGPPTVIQVTTKLRANLDFISNLSLVESEELKSNIDRPDDNESILTDRSSNDDQSETASSDSEQTTESQKQRTPKESMPDFLNRMIRPQGSDPQTVSTSKSTNSQKSRQSSMTTDSARFQELEARIVRQQTELDRKDKISSDRLSSIERQLRRIDEVDQKLDTMKQDIAEQIQASNNNNSKELQKLTQQMFRSMEKQINLGKYVNLLNDKISLLMTILDTATNNGKAQAILGQVPALETQDQILENNETNLMQVEDPSKVTNESETLRSPRKKKVRQESTQPATSSPTET